MLSKSAWERVGGYDVQYKTNGEDATFCQKLIKYKYKISYSSVAKCYHLRNDNLKSLVNAEIIWKLELVASKLARNLLLKLFLLDFKESKYFSIAEGSITTVIKGIIIPTLNNSNSIPISIRKNKKITKFS